MEAHLALILVSADESTMLLVVLVSNLRLKIGAISFVNQVDGKFL